MSLMSQKFKSLLELASKGNAEAQKDIGACYDSGQEGVTKDVKEAFRWYKLSATQGNAEAQCNIGYAYEHGEGIKKDGKEAVHWYTLSATQGHAPAQSNLGNCYLKGEGVKRNPKEAVRWLHLAANQGNVVAQVFLGNCYRKGLGATKDVNEARYWYQLAANQGDRIAQQKLTELPQTPNFTRSISTAQFASNPTDEFKSQLKLASSGNAGAQNNIGYYYESGTEGVLRDIKTAVHWYQLAADQGDKQAQCNLGYAYQHGEGIKKDLKEAVRWYKLSAAEGHAPAQCNLATCYMKGEGVKKDLEEGVRWFHLAATQGNGIAQNCLGDCYSNGVGVKKDKDEGNRWYQLGAETEAREKLILLQRSSVKPVTTKTDPRSLRLNDARPHLQIVPSREPELSKKESDLSPKKEPDLSPKKEPDLSPKKEPDLLLRKDSKEQDTDTTFASRIASVGIETLKTLSPIKGIKDTPLISLAEAVNPLDTLLEGLDMHVIAAEDFANNLLIDEGGTEKNGLTVDEIMAINLYTQAWDVPAKSLYCVLNTTLRSEERNVVKPFFPYLKLLFTAFSKLPQQELTLWRGVKSDLTKDYKVGKNLCWWAFSSCTTDVSVLSSDLFLGKTQKRTLFSVTTKIGVDIMKYSSYKSEREILLPPGIRLSVIGLLDQGDLQIVQLKELSGRLVA